MSIIVQNIFDAFDSEIAAELPTYTKMRRVFNPEQNDPRTAERSYAVRHLSASDAAGVTRVYTLDHGFEVMLLRRFVDRGDDSDLQAVINDLYNQASELLKRFFLSKLGIPSIVLIVDNPSIAEPEVLENSSVLLRVGVNVKYRETIDS